MATAELQETRQVQPTAQGRLLLWLTSRLPSSRQPEQVSLLSPEPKEKDTEDADDGRKGMNAGKDEELGSLLQPTSLTLGKLRFPLEASAPALKKKKNWIVSVLQGS